MNKNNKIYNKYNISSQNKKAKNNEISVNYKENCYLPFMLFQTPQQLWNKSREHIEKGKKIIFFIN